MRKSPIPPRQPPSCRARGFCCCQAAMERPSCTATQVDRETTRLGQGTGARPLSSVFHPRTEPLINTGALARCNDAPSTGELFQFQQFVTSRAKPLKRRTHARASLHRAKAAVLFRRFGSCCNTCSSICQSLPRCEISRLGPLACRNPRNSETPWLLPARSNSEHLHSLKAALLWSGPLPRFLHRAPFLISLDAP
jgi:hypothetical protein